jgi:tetratricopeptide (TPR) repeat protein
MDSAKRHFQKGRYHEALSSLNEVLEQSPDLVPALLLRANVQGQLGNHLLAIRDARLALAHRASSRGYLRLTQSLMALSRTKEAVESVAMGLSLDRSHPKLLELKDQLIQQLTEQHLSVSLNRLVDLLPDEELEKVFTPHSIAEALVNTLREVEMGHQYANQLDFKENGMALGQPGALMHFTNALLHDERVVLFGKMHLSAMIRAQTFELALNDKGIHDWDVDSFIQGYAIKRKESGWLSVAPSISTLIRSTLLEAFIYKHLEKLDESIRLFKWVLDVLYAAKLELSPESGAVFEPSYERCVRITYLDTLMLQKDVHSGYDVSVIEEDAQKVLDSLQENPISYVPVPDDALQDLSARVLHTLCQTMHLAKAHLILGQYYVIQGEKYLQPDGTGNRDISFFAKAVIHYDAAASAFPEDELLKIVSLLKTVQCALYAGQKNTLLSRAMLKSRYQLAIKLKTKVQLVFGEHYFEQEPVFHVLIPLIQQALEKLSEQELEEGVQTLAISAT